MANVIINDTNLTNIANAIRGKNGTTTTYKPNEMAAAITAITTGGGGTGEMGPIELTGVCFGTFSDYSPVADTLWENKDNITTSDVTSIEDLFLNKPTLNNENVDLIPFEINGIDNNILVMKRAFYGLKYLEECPVINGTIKPSGMDEMFYDCQYLRYIPEGWSQSFDFSTFNSSSAFKSNASDRPYNSISYGCGGFNDLFYNCYSLRSIDSNLLSNIFSKCPGNSASYARLFNCCYVLENIEDLGVQDATLTNNCFSNTFNNLHRIRKITFATDDGTPKVRSWKNQTIDLSTWIGFYNNEAANKHLTGYNSGLTYSTSKSAPTYGYYSSSTYENCKDHPDRCACSAAYSEYNLDQAVETINSLPDTSAYLATQSGATNTIKFNSTAGEQLGKAINTMTAAQIAIATAKGWTVSFV